MVLLTACGSSEERRRAGKPLSYMDYAVALHELGVVVECAAMDYVVASHERGALVEKAAMVDTSEQIPVLQDVAAIKTYCESAGCYYDPLWDDLYFVTGYHLDDPKGCILAFPASCSSADTPVLLRPTSIIVCGILPPKCGVTQQTLRQEPWIPVKNSVSKDVLSDLQSRLRGTSTR